MTADSLRRGPVATAIRRQRLIVVLRGVRPLPVLLALVGDLADDGARAFEITFDAPSAEGDLVAVRTCLDARPDGPYLVGAGSIVRRGQLETARRAGASFAVATLFDSSLVDAAVAEGLVFIPGAFSPTEVHAAWSAGATFVKLFPASALGPTFIRELRGPMPDVQLLPSGGVDGANARAFLDAGAAALGIGGAITRADPASRRALIGSIASVHEGPS